MTSAWFEAVCDVVFFILFLLYLSYVFRFFVPFVFVLIQDLLSGYQQFNQMITYSSLICIIRLNIKYLH
jgi:hypothetical protein